MLLLVRPAPLALALVAVFFLALASSKTASAHAVLERSEPAAGARLVVPPSEIEMWFNEPLEQSFSGAELLRSNGRAVPETTVHFDSSDETHMTLVVDDLGPGYYTVAWQTLSTIDDHEWRGSFSFVVLNPDGSVPIEGPFDNGDTRSTPSVPKILARWLSLGGAMTLAGILAFTLLVAHPVLRAREQFTTLTATRLAGRMVLLGVGGAIVAILGGLLQLGLDLERLGGLQAFERFVLESRTGAAWLLRQVLLLISAGILVAAWRWPANRGFSVGGLSLSLVTAGGALATFSLVSHAAAGEGRAWTIALDFVHLATAATWLGGLLALAMSLLFFLRPMRETAAARQLITRFSSLAVLSVFVLGVTGVLAAMVQIPSWPALIDSSYGRSLLVKLALLAPLLGIAAANRWLLRSGNVQSVARFVWFEAGVGAVLMVSVAVLVQMPTTQPVSSAPSAVTQAEASEREQRHTWESDELGVELSLGPGIAGPNTVEVDIYTPGDESVGEVAAVILRTTHPERGLSTVELEPVGAGTYIGQEVVLAQAGAWLVEVDVRRPGHDDVRAEFSTEIDEAPAADTDSAASAFGNPLAGRPPSAVAGVAIVALGLGLVIWRRKLPLGPGAASAAGFISGLTMTTAGVILITVGIAAAPFSDSTAGQATSGFSPTLELRYRTNGERYVDLAIAPFAVGDNTFRVTVLNSDAQPVAAEPVQLRFSQLLDPSAPATVQARPAEDGLAQTARHELGQTGWWNVDVTLGDSEQASFYLRLDDLESAPNEFAPSEESADPEAETLFWKTLERLQKTSFVTWTDELSSGIPHAERPPDWFLTEGEIAAPDAMRWTIHATDGVRLQQYWVGETRCMSSGVEDDDWRCSSTMEAQPLARKYLESSTGFQLGRTEEVGERGTRTLSFYNPSQRAWYVWWIDTETGYPLQRAMVATGHFMLTTYLDYGVANDISIPSAEDGS